MVKRLTGGVKAALFEFLAVRQNHFGSFMPNPSFNSIANNFPGHGRAHSKPLSKNTVITATIQKCVVDRNVALAVFRLERL